MTDHIGEATKKVARRVVRPFGDAEDAEIAKLRIQQCSLGMIASIVGRAKSSVQMRLQTLAEREEAADAFLARNGDDQ